MIPALLCVAATWTTLIAILIWRITKPPPNPPCPQCHHNPWHDNPDKLN